MRMRTALVALAIPAALALSESARAQEEAFPSVRVHIDGDPRVVLEMRDELGWTPVCRAPCNQRVPLVDGFYRINGEGIQQSRRFKLPSTYGETRIEVVPASAGLHVLGLTLVGLGSASFASGLMTMITAWLSESCSDCVGGFANTTAPNIAWALMGAGVLSVLGGSWITAETRTQVNVTTESPSAKSAIPERRAFVAPPVVGVPLVGFSF